MDFRKHFFLSGLSARSFNVIDPALFWMFASDVLFIFGILRHEIEINHLKNIDSRHVTNRDDLGLVLTYSAVFDTSGFPPFNVRQHVWHDTETQTVWSPKQIEMHRNPITDSTELVVWLKRDVNYQRLKNKIIITIIMKWQLSSCIYSLSK